MLPYLSPRTCLPAWGTVGSNGTRPEPTRIGEKKLIPTTHYSALADLFIESESDVQEVVFDPTTHTTNGIRQSMKRALADTDVRVVARGGGVYLSRREKR